MTDDEYAVIIYCNVFRVNNDDGDTCVSGVFDMIKTLSDREQAALESYYRNGNTFKQTGLILNGIKPEVARRLVNKAVLKLKHPSRLKYLSNSLKFK